ncbi:MAG TPA: DUF3885 domain-containing protein [Candidatus Bathyarchaeia archaeon]|nr:DUF3885 domain-containing protein [Candidatus Bathyarchaeia archaeon]
MDLNAYLNGIFPELILKPSLYKQWAIGIHFEFSKGMDQFKDDGKLNLNKFEHTYHQASSIFNDLFQENDEIFLVTNVYHHKACKHWKHRIKVYDRYIKRKEVKYRVKLETFPYIFDDEEELDQYDTSRFLLKCCKLDMKYSLIIQAACNEDFPNLKPRLGRKCCSYYPDVFFVNTTKNVIFFIYDDRGCEVIATDKEVIRPLFEKYNDWIAIYDCEEIVENFK